MLMINGTDYTIYAAVFATFIFLFTLQYFLCVKTQNRLLRAIPFLLPLASFGAAIISAASYGHNSGFVDLSLVMAGLLVIYTVICLLAIAAARLVYGYRSRKMPR